MEVCMSLKAHALVPTPSNSKNLRTTDDSHLIRRSLSSSQILHHQIQKRQQRKRLMVVEAKGKRGMQACQFNLGKQPYLAFPKNEDDGSPIFVIFIRKAKDHAWYPIGTIAGDTTGKYKKDTLSKDLAGVIYKNEKEVEKTAIQKHPQLRSATKFEYGYKIVEGKNPRAAPASSDVIELPTKPNGKFGLVHWFKFNILKFNIRGGKMSFGKFTGLNSTSDTESQEDGIGKPWVES